METRWTWLRPLITQAVRESRSSTERSVLHAPPPAPGQFLRHETPDPVRPASGRSWRPVAGRPWRPAAGRPEQAALRALRAAALRRVRGGVGEAERARGRDRVLEQVKDR